MVQNFIANKEDAEQLNSGFSNSWISDENWTSKNIYNILFIKLKVAYRMYELCKFIYCRA